MRRNGEFTKATTPIPGSGTTAFTSLHKLGSPMRIAGAITYFVGLCTGSVGCLGLVSGFTWCLLSSLPSSRLGFGPGLISVNMCCPFRLWYWFFNRDC